MPVIARFYGLIIKMFFISADHTPPHIHASYGEYDAAFDINTSELIAGDLPKRAQGLVVEWIGLHRAELLEMWKRQEFKELPPLQ